MRALYLAWRDIRSEKTQFACIVALIVAVASPFVLLLSIKIGVMNALVGTLRDIPEIRRVSIVGNHGFDDAVLDELRSWPEIGFIAPQSRSIARRIEVTGPAGGRLLRMALVPTAAGDPLLPADVAVGANEIAVSQRLARELGLSPGDRVEAIARRGNPATEVMRFGLTVARVLPAGGLDGLAALMNADEIEAVEAFYDGYAFPERGVAAGLPLAERPVRFESFRIFARDIAEVPALEARLESVLQTEVRSQAAEIDSILRLDQNLGRALGVLFAVGLIGLATSLAALFWSTVQRKRASLSLLALMGVGTAELSAIPVIQALIHAVAGALLTCLVLVAGSFAVNWMFAGRLPEGARVAVIEPAQFLLVTLVICGVAAAASAFAARSAARADPATVIRMGER